MSLFALVCLYVPELRGYGKLLAKLMYRVENVRVIVDCFWWVMPFDGFLAGGFVIACDYHVASVDGIYLTNHLGQE
jgi:hypothetical protein